jgi:hypothetical protein
MNRVSAINVTIREFFRYRHISPTQTEYVLECTIIYDIR